jgi:ribosome modulation factor
MRRMTPEQGAFQQGSADRYDGYTIDVNCPYTDPKRAEAWRMGWRKRDKELTLSKEWTAPTKIRRCYCASPEFDVGEGIPARPHVCQKCGRPATEKRKL